MRTRTIFSMLAALAGCAVAAAPADAQIWVAKLAGTEKPINGRAYACSSERESTIVLMSADADTSILMPMVGPRFEPGTTPIGSEGSKVVYMSTKVGMIHPDSGTIQIDSVTGGVVYGRVAMINGDSLLAVVLFGATNLGMWPENDGLNCRPGFKMVHVSRLGWPKRYADAVVDGRVLVGMSPAMVRAALGTPTRIVRTESTQGAIERWLYGPTDFVEFKSGRVSLLQQSR